ncbi:hypothetical protein L226DRAFT_34724 [Lentinus tigrinus ALCF2SS1-7]|uniref:uncharacterized protein n=1 Tax=Lentinus tigrinus ALCF2SS1-7 TaxID=1328758 RepID=UPI001165F831|nr:hypothetical protein L226DRAFT_34724 [Lentinus tigrinus ALCF2SS1-7]
MPQAAAASAPGRCGWQLCSAAWIAASPRDTTTARLHRRMVCMPAPAGHRLEAGRSSLLTMTTYLGRCIRAGTACGLHARLRRRPVVLSRSRRPPDSWDKQAITIWVLGCGEALERVRWTLAFAASIGVYFCAWLEAGLSGEERLCRHMSNTVS